jgi:SAM-dependent methyltransferase
MSESSSLHSGSADETKYTHGHHESVLRSHRWRTAENSAAYLLPYLTPGMSLIDVGCGPGTITLDLATRVAPGRVIGVDAAEEAIAIGQSSLVARGDLTGSDTSFCVGDAYALDLPDNSVDVVHAHQVLQHLADPLRALTEWKRVVKPGGIVAARDADYAAMSWFPDDSRLHRWMAWYQQTARRNGGEPDAGRQLLSWANAVGFSSVEATGSMWCFSNSTDREWWGSLWADRVTKSAFAEQLLAEAVAEPHELDDVAQAFHRWAANADGWFGVVHGEIVCRVR